jgi:hypothetical protein
VQFAITCGTIFRILPFAVGASFLLFQNRSSISALAKRTLVLLTQFPQSARAAWHTCRRSASTYTSTHTELRPTETRRDGSLKLASVPRAPPRSSEVLPLQAARRFDAFEGSLAEIAGEE